MDGWMEGEERRSGEKRLIKKMSLLFLVLSRLHFGKKTIGYTYCNVNLSCLDRYLRR
jgi:hypothetical protein